MGREILAHLPKKMHTGLFTAPGSVKQQEIPPAGGWANSVSHSHTTEYYTAAQDKLEPEVFVGIHPHTIMTCRKICTAQCHLWKV